MNHRQKGHWRWRRPQLHLFSTTCFSRLLIAALGAVMPIEIIVALTKAFVFVMPMFSAGDVQKRPEAALLRIVKTIVERLCCIGEFF